MRNKTLFLSVLYLALSAVPVLASPAEEAAKLIPVQHNGRIKPFDSFARQTLRLLSGGDTWQKRSATVTMLEILSNTGRADKEPWIRVELPELKNYLSLDSKRHYFSLQEIAPVSPKVVALIRSAKEKRDKDQRPTKLEQKAELLYGQLDAAGKLSDGDSPAVIPATQGWQGPLPNHHLPIEIF